MSVEVALRAACRVCLKNRGVLNIFLYDSALVKLTACASVQVRFLLTRNLHTLSVEVALRAACRVCLKNCGVLNIFLSESALVEHKLKKINRDDGLPDSLCEMCASNLNIAYCFRVQCQESDKILQSVRTSCSPAVLKLEVEPDIPIVKFEELLIKKENEYIDCEPQADNSVQCEVLESNAHYRTDCRSLLAQVNECTEPVEYREDSPENDNSCHDDEEHNTMSELKCPHCPYRATDRLSHNDHLLAHRSDERTCEYCGKLVRGAGRIRKHENTHVNTQRTCEICGTVMHKYKFKNHVAKHTEGYVDKYQSAPRVCPICSKVLSCRSSLQNHLMRHVDMELQCDSCGKRYRNKMSLRAHIKTHEHKKRFPCCFCGKLYSSPKYLAAHERTHRASGGKFHCGLCDRAFVTLAHLKSHSLNKHKGQHRTRRATVPAGGDMLLNGTRS